MRELHTVLRQVVVKQFYYRNTGFFLVAFFVLFGVQKPATFFISPFFLAGVAASPFFTALVLMVLLLYYFKCLYFYLKTLRAPQNELLYIAALLPKKELRLSLARTHLLLFLPAVVYSVWLAVVGLATGGYAAFPMVLLYQLALLVGTVLLIEKKICQTSGRSKPIAFPKLPTLPWPPFLWPLRFMVNQELVMLGLTKLVSIMVLIGFMQMYPHQLYDLRPTRIGLLMGIALQVLLVRRMHEFLEVDLVLHRRLPYSFMKRIFQLTILFLVLLLPEAFFLFRLAGGWNMLWPLTELWLFGVGFLLLQHTLLYRTRFTQETYLRLVFLQFMALLLLLLFAPPTWLLGASFFGVAGVLYNRWYYAYETFIDRRE